MLDRPQKDQRVAQEATERLREIAALGQPENRAQAVPLAQPRIIAGVEELERLNEELDLADAAAAELDVAALDALGTERLVDLLLHAADGGDDIGIDARPEHEGPDHLDEPRGHPGVAGAKARLDERLPLPELGALGQIGPIALEREDDAAHPPLGTEAQVHAEGMALLGDGFERLDDVPRDRSEVVAVRHASLGAPRRLPVLPVDEDQVDVGGVVELVATELAHADHGQARGLAVGRLRDPVARGEALLGPAPRRVEADIGQARELLRRHRQVGVAQDVAAADAEELTVLEAAARVPAGLRPLERARGLRERGHELVAEPLPHGCPLEEPGEKRRVAAERVGEKLAGSAEPGDEVEGPRMGAQHAEEGGALALGGQALEVVERHVGIGRFRQLLEEPRQERPEQLGVPRLGRERVEVGQRRARLGEAQPLELAERGLVVRRRCQEVGHVLTCPLPGGQRVQMAASPFSPVRMRMASPMGRTKTLPSPMEPVRAAAAMSATTLSTSWSGTTSSTLTLGRKSIVYSEPR